MRRNAAEPGPCIRVLAGANGAGKSSIAGAFIRELGGDYFNPDEVARAIARATRGIGGDEANSLAWRKGVELLRSAIARRNDFSLETTLGGETITKLLDEALDAGLEVRVWFIGLSTADLHVQRVASRVLQGGHPIPVELVRRRFDHGRLNLIRLLPRLTELRVYDKSAAGDPAAGKAPSPQLVIHVVNGVVRAPKDLRSTLDWAKPIVAAVLKSVRPRS